MSSVAAAANQAPSPQRRDPAIPKVDVEALVEAWRAAQTRGDFTSYSALYHPLFQGTKRVGDKTARFDRDRWLVDRRGLFRWDNLVLVRELRISTGERTAVATFTQEWSTPAFRDVGPKRLEMVLEGGRLVITREEMIASEVAGAGAAELPRPEELAVLFPWEQKYFAVLGKGPVPVTGRARRVGPYAELRHLVEKDVPVEAIAKWKPLLGRTMTLYSGGRPACTGLVTGFRGIGGVFGTDEVKLDTPPEGKSEALWEWLPDSATHLVAVIEPSVKGCSAEWARASDLPAPTILERREPTLGERERLRRELERTGTAKEVQRYYDLFRKEGEEEVSTAPKSWIDYKPREWAITAFVEPGSGATYLVTELFVGDSCDRFRGYSLGFFKVAEPVWVDVTGNGDPTDLFALRPLYGVGPGAAVVLRAGGRPIFVGSGVLYVQGKRGFAPAITASLYRTICSC